MWLGAQLFRLPLVDAHAVGSDNQYVGGKPEYVHHTYAEKLVARSLTILFLSLVDCFKNVFVTKRLTTCF